MNKFDSERWFTAKDKAPVTKESLMNQPQASMDTTVARNRLVVVVRDLAVEKRADLESLKEEAAGLDRPDFLWHYLLQSFSTMGRASGWYGLIDNEDNYRRVTYPVLAALARENREQQVRQVCRAAGIRMPDRKAGFILGCFERVKGLGGPEEAKKKLLALPGRESKIRFLRQLPGIGPKYSRNIMMDVYHEDFRNSIALDVRIRAISKALGLSFPSYAAHEKFYLGVAWEAGLNGWELDRLLFKFRSAVEARLGVSGAVVGRSKLGCGGGHQMANPPDNKLFPAKGAAIKDLSIEPKVIAQLEQLHDLVLSVCPDCLIEQRRDEAMIYVPPQRQDARRDKNLLTVWAEKAGVRMRIMPDSEEMYDPSKRDIYLKRLNRLYAKLVGRGRVSRV